MFNIIGIGEILWDVLPEGKRMGGAPSNFAYVAGALGNRAAVLSRVGDDDAGRAILGELRAKKLSAATIQIDRERPTGVVCVNFDAAGQPSYEIARHAAWDYLELTEQWRETALAADAVCFGSLAQRGAVSSRTIRETVNLVKKLRIFDVNLRGGFYTREVLRKSLNMASVAKFNADELPIVAEMFEIKKQNPLKAARELLFRFGLQMVCATRGAHGSLLVTKKDFAEHAGTACLVADTVGAGDAFTAALAHGLLRRWQLGEINEFANKIGAFVASRTGAMPDFPEEFRQ